MVLSKKEFHTQRNAKLLELYHGFLDAGFKTDESNEKTVEAFEEITGDRLSAKLVSALVYTKTHPYREESWQRYEENKAQHTALQEN